MIKDTKQAEQDWKTERAKRDLEEGRLRDCLQKRDKLIEVCVFSLSCYTLMLHCRAECLPDIATFSVVDLYTVLSMTTDCHSVMF